MALMSSGGGLSDGKLELATAAPEDVLSGKMFYSGNKNLKIGTMYNRGSWEATVKLGNSVTIPAGYHNGFGRVSADVSSTVTEYIHVYTNSTGNTDASLRMVYYHNNVQSDSVTIYFTSTRSFHFLNTIYSGQRWTVSSSAITGRASVSGSNMIVQDSGFNSSTWVFTSSQNFVVYRIDTSGITGATFPL